MLCVQDCDARLLVPSINVVFGQEERTGDANASNQCCTPHKNVSSSEIHAFTPKADSPRRQSIASETSASVPVFSPFERPGNLISNR